MRLGIVIPTAIALAAIWGGVAIVMSMTDEYISSPEKVAQMVKNAPWHGGKKPSSAERKAYLDELARFYSMLDFDQRRRLREDDTKGDTMLFMAELTEEERKSYLSKILEAQFQPLLKAWPNINKEERRKMLGISRSEMRKQGRDNGSLDRLQEDDEQVFQKLIDDGITNYYQNGNDERKMNLAPLMEELQARMQGVRRR